MSITDWVGIIVGILTLVGMLVGVTTYIAQLQFKVKQERLELEKEHAEKNLHDLEAKHQQLLDHLVEVRKSGMAALTKKMEIDDDLGMLMRLVRAKAGSVYIPLRSGHRAEATGLIFLSIQPFGKEAASLKNKIIPLQSLAGRCFKTGQPFVRSNAKGDPDHYDRADKVSGYRTQDSLNLPLRYRDEVIGVVQLLNKEGAEKFDNNDILRAEPIAATLASKVFQFSQIPDSIELLGITPDRDAQVATIMFCDITQSSILFRELSTSSAIEHLNEYFERICDIAFRYGATVDKYMGDGVIFRFNVPRPVDNHPLKAVQAALDIQQAFEGLKSDWLAVGDLVEELYTRIGIAYGPVYQAEVGHPQYRYLTVFGPPVNVAVNLCETARRDQNTIVIDELLHQRLDNRVDVVPFPKEQLGKAASFISKAYELRRLM